MPRVEGRAHGAGAFPRVPGFHNTADLTAYWATSLRAARLLLSIKTSFQLMMARRRVASGTRLPTCCLLLVLLRLQQLGLHLGLVVVLQLCLGLGLLRRLEFVATCGVVRDRGPARCVTRVGPVARGQVVASGRALAVILLRLQICSVVAPAAIATAIALMVLHLLVRLIMLSIPTITKLTLEGLCWLVGRHLLRVHCRVLLSLSLGSGAPCNMF